jgi:hypothetical protein
MLGTEQAEQVIATTTGGKRLAVYLTRDFFKQHVQQYRKRPVYWLLQSPRRTYSLLVFHERLTPDTLCGRWTQLPWWMCTTFIAAHR